MIFLTFNLIELTIKIGKKLPEKLEKIRKKCQSGGMIFAKF